ncbi:hypothetical protein ACLMJK_009019 [Lecanora helva]
MHTSARLLSPGFAKRSVDEFKRFARIAVNLEGLRTPTKPYPLLSFADPDTVPQCKTMSDADLGGFSSVRLDQIPPSHSEPAHARFHGSISTDLPRNRPQVQRTGYAGWRNKDRGPTIFGKSLWDVDSYTYLALRVKSDGRKYFVNIQTESIVYTDLHQHRLHTQRPGEWETVLINFNAFVRTNHGEVVEPQTEMLRQKVRTVGISLTDRVPGPFDLAVSQIWASNALDGEASLEAEVQGSAAAENPGEGAR